MITSFSGEYRFLSNFWPALVAYNGICFPSVEHAYQAAKTNDRVLQLECSRLPKPGLAKAFGKRHKARDDWKDVKYSIMLDLCHQKFGCHPHLTALLLGTGDADLIEGNTWGDVYWGVCRGSGENNLGKILMQVRSALRKADSTKGNEG